MPKKNPGPSSIREQDLHKILDNMADTFYQVDLAGKLIMISRSVKHLLGYHESEIIGKNHVDLFVDPEARKRLLKELEETGGNVVGFEVALRHKSGRIVWVSTCARYTYDKKGKIIGFEGVSRDITRQKEAEDALRESEENLRQLTENIREIFWISEPKRKKMLYVSPVYKEVWGRSCKSLYEDPMSFLEVVHPEDQQEIRNSIQQAGEEGYDLEYRILPHGSKMRWVRDRAFPIPGPDNKVQRIAGIIEDITPQKKIQEELERQTKERTRELIQIRQEMEQAYQVKTHFLSRVNHELRTPLNAILGFSQLLQAELEPDLSEKHNAYLEEIRHAGDHLLYLISDLLDLSKVEQGKVQLKHEAVSVQQTGREAVSMVNILAQQKNIHMTNRLPESPETRIIADPKRFKQILINLLCNAIRYNRENGTVDIFLKEPQGDTALICISDTGPGYTQEELDLLFEPFEDLSETIGQPGPGLGLVISRDLVEQMGGKLQVESTKGSGSTFCVELPLST